MHVYACRRVVYVLDMLILKSQQCLQTSNTKNGGYLDIEVTAMSANKQHQEW